MPEDTDGAYTRGLVITPPEAQSPPEHFHLNYDEDFEVSQTPTAEWQESDQLAEVAHITAALFD